jgi:hypothetical protein
MAQVAIQGTPISVVDFTQTYAQVKSAWSDDNWKTVDYLQPISATAAVSPNMPSATFLYHYGEIKREDSAAFAQYSPLNIVNKYVRIVAFFPNGPQVLCIITDESFDMQGAITDPQGDQTVIAYGLEHLLDRISIEGALTDQGVIGWCPPFNESGHFGGQLQGNRSAAKLGNYYVFSGDADVWMNSNIIEYLIYRYCPLPIVIAGQGDVLTQIYGSYYFEGYTLRQALDKLIERRRGTGWFLNTDGTGNIELRIFPVLGETISVGDFTFSGNPNKLSLILDDAIDVENCTTQMAYSTLYDRIVIQGARKKLCFTLAVADGNLIPGWKAYDEASYRALSGDSEENDLARQSTLYDAVYQRFIVSPTWDWKANLGNGVMKSILPDGAPRWNYPRPLLRWIPIEKAGGDVGVDEYEEPMAFIFDSEESIYYSVEKPGESGIPGGNIRMIDNAMGITLKSQINHIYGLNHFLDNDGESEIEPVFDYANLVATVAAEIDDRIKIIVNLTGQIADIGRTLVIDVHDAEHWTIAAGTATGILNGQLIREPVEKIVRNDTAKIKAIAALARAWYSVYRASLNISVKTIMAFPALGSIITEVSSAWHKEPINTIVTSKRWDFRSGTSALETGYSDLDVRAMLDIPGMSDFRAVGRAFGRQQKQISDLRERIGSLPSRLNASSYIPANIVRAPNGGTPNIIPKFLSANEIGDSIIKEVDGKIGISTTPQTKLHVNGSAIFAGPSSGIDGELVWDSTAHCYKYYNADTEEWLALAGGGITYTGTLWTQDGSNIYYDGNVGIGTAAPGGKFHLTSGTDDAWAAIFVSTANTGKSYGINVTAGTNVSDMAFRIESKTQAPYLIVRGDGNVGIGTITPGSKLTVHAGDLRLSNSQAAAGTFGQLQFFNNQGYSATSRAYIEGRRTAEGDDGWLDFATTPGTNIAPSVRMTIGSQGNVGIGTINPDSRLNVSANTSSSPGSLPSGTIGHIVGADNAVSRMLVDAFANTPAFTGRRATGTAANPSAILANVTLAQFGGQGYGATGYSSASRASISAMSSEDWTDAAQGTHLIFSTSVIGAAAATEKMRIANNGNVGIGTTSPDANSILDLTSTTKGFLPPRMTTAQISAIDPPAEGLDIYDITTHRRNIFTGSAWVYLLTSADIISFQAVDSDKLDGYHASAFAAASHGHSQSDITGLGTALGILATEISYKQNALTAGTGIYIGLVDQVLTISTSNVDAAKLEGHAASYYLAATAQAADSDKLDGYHASSFLGATAQAADSAKLNGQSASYYLEATAAAADSAKLNGQSAEFYLPATGTAADSSKLNGQSASYYLAATAKAADSDKLNGQLASYYLAATAKAADSDKLNGQSASYYAIAEALTGKQDSLAAGTGISIGLINQVLTISASGVDADRLDGHHASYFAPESHSHSEGDVIGLVLELGALAADIALKAGASHSHAQSDITSLVTDLSNLSSAISEKAAASHSHSESDITGLTTDLSGKLGTMAQAADSDKLDGNHASYFLTTTGTAADSSKLENHAASYFLAATAQAADSDKLDGYHYTSFAPASHGHSESDITGLTSDLIDLSSAISGKAAAEHGHAESEITGLATDLSDLSSAISGKAASSHNHAQSDITGLATSLSAKQDALTAGTGISIGIINQALTISLDIPRATAQVSGYLHQEDFAYFAGKQDAILIDLTPGQIIKAGTGGDTLEDSLLVEYLGHLGFNEAAPSGSIFAARTFQITDEAWGAEFDAAGQGGGRAALISYIANTYVGNTGKGEGDGVLYLLSGDGVVSMGFDATNGIIGINPDLLEMATIASPPVNTPVQGLWADMTNFAACGSAALMIRLV